MGSSMSGLEQRSYIVTGAGGSIGRAAALILARRGANVVVADIVEAAAEETVRLIRAEGGNAVYSHCDVSIEDNAWSAVELAITEFGRLDGAFNNAGLPPVNVPLHQDRKSRRLSFLMVTGPGGVIVRAAVLILALRGANVVVADIVEAAAEETVRLIRAEGGNAVYSHCDVSIEDNAWSAVELAITEFGRLDGAFNNAGLPPVNVPLHQLTRDRKSTRLHSSH